MTDLSPDWIFRRFELTTLLEELKPAFRTIEDLQHYIRTVEFKFVVWKRENINYEILSSESISINSTTIHFPKINGISLCDKLLYPTIGVFCTSVAYRPTSMPNEFINYTIAKFIVECLSKYVACGKLRPAIGYPVCPDHSVKRLVFDLLECPLTLNKYYAIDPPTTICGFLI